MSDEFQNDQKRRPRSATLLNLGWIRERLKKAEKIKEKIDSGAYEVNPEQLAKALLNKDE